MLRNTIIVEIHVEASRDNAMKVASSIVRMLNEKRREKQFGPDVKILNAEILDVLRLSPQFAVMVIFDVKAKTEAKIYEVARKVRRLVVDKRNLDADPETYKILTWRLTLQPIRE